MHARLRAWAMAGMLNENAVLRMGLAEKLAGMLDPGHLALTRMTDRLVALRQQANPRLPQSPGVLQQYEALSAHFSQRAAYKEKALAQRGLMVQAGEHSEQIFTRWRAGQYDGWSLAGRCYIVLEELRWGPLAMPAAWQITMWRQCLRITCAAWRLTIWRRGSMPLPPPAIFIING